MKNLIFVFVTLLIFTFNTNANNPDTLDFTVIAPSGLSLRNAPSLAAERLEILPYGTLIKSIGQWDEIYDLAHIDTIDTREGYWIQTNYDGKKGYLFSAYLKNGPLYVPSTEINRDFRITIPGERCQSINYDPTLNWYGIYVDEATGATKVKATDISIEQTNLIPEDEEMAYADYGDFLNVKSAQKDSFLMFLGLPNTINTGEIAFEKSYFDNQETEHWDKQGKFIYPYEKIQIAQDGYEEYYLAAQETIVTNEEEYSYEIEQPFTRKYEVFLANNMGRLSYSDEDAYCISKEIGADQLHQYEYVTNLGPRLLWQGDLNNDGFPEVLFYTPYMAECCGGAVTYHLLISEKRDGEWILKKAAEDEVFSCYGC